MAHGWLRANAQEAFSALLKTDQFGQIHFGDVCVVFLRLSSVFSLPQLSRCGLTKTVREESKSAWYEVITRNVILG